MSDEARGVLLRFERQLILFGADIDRVTWIT